MDIKVRGKYEDKPLKVKDIRPMLKNIRIRSKSKQKDAEDENRQNPQNYAEYKTSTASKKVAEKSILAVTFSVKRLEIKEKQHTAPTSEESGSAAAAGPQVMQFSAKNQKEKKAAQTVAATRQHAVQQTIIRTRRQQRRRKRNYQIKRIKNQIRNQTIASSSIVLLAMVLFVFTLSMFFFLADDGEGNLEAGQPALMVSIAKSQIGTKGGEKYWRWYGFTEPVDWCACFVSWCASEAGLIEEGMVPKFAEVNEGIRWFQEHGRWIDASELKYKPSPGTLIFFDWEQDGVADHVGIVEGCRSGIVYTIEGNSGNLVANRYYLHNSSKIRGYTLSAINKDVRREEDKNTKS
ncbi:MAG: CHAP domain-containing protein [Firmicutes bacterium]|nr:CHAP domain-containing protein [Bacillota bacterium]